MIRYVTIYVDGYCKGNPGKGGAVVILEWNDTDGKTGKFVRDLTLLDTTNNRAEYESLILALREIMSEVEHIRANQIDIKMDITIFTDSQLLVGHLTKNWKVNKNEDLFNTVSFLMGQIKANHNLQLKYIPREENKAGIEIDMRV